MTNQQSDVDASAGAVKVGTLIAGKYRVDRELGRGGMSVVFAATHVQLEQRVAIKLLGSRAASDPDCVARFAREARAVARIRNEHVVRVSDVGTLDRGGAYLVMEYLDGHDLAAVLGREGALSIPVAVGYVLEACEAIAAAHAVGIVHRDLKPANLFLAKSADRSTMIKVLDFGISKIMSGGSDAGGADLTRTGDGIGTPAYMSPEQLRGAGSVDQRTDIWSFGVVLYELLTGRAPFEKPSLAEVAAAIIRDPTPPLRDHLPDAPVELSRVISRATRKDPNQRYANVGELARALLPFGPPGSTAAVVRCEALLASLADTADGPLGLDASAFASLGLRQGGASRGRGQATMPLIDEGHASSHTMSRAGLNAPHPIRRLAFASLVIAAAAASGAAVAGRTAGPRATGAETSIVTPAPPAVPPAPPAPTTMLAAPAQDAAVSSPSEPRTAPAATSLAAVSPAVTSPPLRRPPQSRAREARVQTPKDLERF